MSWRAAAWFGVAYVLVSVTVTVLLLVGANKLLGFGGPKGMIRAIGLLVLAIIGWIVFAAKKAVNSDPDVTAKGEIKKTVKKVSSWLDDLKQTWDEGKKK